MTDKPHYIGHRNRLKERLKKNAAGLQDYEVLELVLGYALPRRDTKPLAKALLNRFGTLAGVYGARPEELADIAGVGPGLVTFWRLWREYWARVEESKLRQREVLDSPEVVADMARARLGYLGKEELWLACLDAKNRLLAFCAVSRGTVNQSAVYPREILAEALRREAGGIILVHNHPGGDPVPSKADRDLTRRIAFLAQEMGLRLLDHIIVAEKKYYSFQEKGLL